MQDSIGRRLARLHKGEINRLNISKLTESIESGLPNEEFAQEIMVDIKQIKDMRVETDRL